MKRGDPRLILGHDEPEFRELYMKAAFVAGKDKVELRDVAVPEIGTREILVRMRVCGICGTDIEKVHGDHITPLVLGHEVAGEVAKVGRDVHIFAEGDWVFVHHHISCRSCYYCKNGFETLCEDYPKSNLDPCGFSEYFRVPETLVKEGTVYRLPASMTFEEGSQVEPTACCIRALTKADINPGRSAAIFGAGPIGLLYVQLLKHYGLSPVVSLDLFSKRRKMASELGADVTIDPLSVEADSEIIKSTDNRGVDYAIIATGSLKAVEQAVRVVRKGGTILLFGAPTRGAVLALDASRLFLREIRFQSSYSTSETEMKMALRLIQGKSIDVSRMITHRIPLDRVLEGLKLAESQEASKVIIEN